MKNEFLIEGLEQLAAWQARWHVHERDASLHVPAERMRAIVTKLIERLHDNYPFWHPSYAGQMLKPPHELARIAYFLAQQINPNNHALDGGPATAHMETEVMADMAQLFGFESFLGHLTSSGTVANLEALWVARNLHPEKAIAFSSEAHYTHRRMCEVINARPLEIKVDHAGRMDLDDLRAQLKTGAIGTVVLTSGTTALGAVDPIHEAVTLQREFDFRIHVDGAYGGFFKLLSDTLLLREPDAAAFRAIAACDSIVVDPHKHGLQPYGCGSILFRDPGVGRFYKHDSPYTYFTSDELHLGEISLECSRAGAAAAALWATLQAFPLKPEIGLGAILQKTRQAALEWAHLLDADELWHLVTPPSLDIIAFFPANAAGKVSVINHLTHRIFSELMHDLQHPIYLAKLNLVPAMLSSFDQLQWDAPALVALRSVLMKPEHLAYIPILHERISQALKNCL